MSEVNRMARESFGKTLETGAETVRGVQEGITSALENVRDLNVRLINGAPVKLTSCLRDTRALLEPSPRSQS